MPLEWCPGKNAGALQASAEGSPPVSKTLLAAPLLYAALAPSARVLICHVSPFAGVISPEREIAPAKCEGALAVLDTIGRRQAASTS